MTAEAEGTKRILILCVDRDDDLGIKTKIQTPVLGKEENLNAAVSLALSDPEEPDANAMFEAVRLYNRMQGDLQSDETLEISTISGSELGGVEADRQVVSELKELLSSFPATEVILVTDGYSDEAVLPLVESRVPVSSVRRIVVKHSKSIEETVALFTQYLKMIWENPRYARIALGIPGVLLLILGIFSAFNLLYQYWIAFIIFIGVVLLVKGFGGDQMARNFLDWLRDYSPPPLPTQIFNYSALVGILCVLVSIYLGWGNAAAKVTPPHDMVTWISLLPQITGFFLQGAVDFLIVGVCTVLLGRSIRMYFERDIRLLYNSALLAMVGWSRWILMGTSEILISPEIGGQGNLFLYIGIGILVGIASALVVIVIRRMKSDFFELEGEEQIEETSDG
ncbi:MAG: DUF373 family protein [Thermoproteota archaeon]